MELKAFLDLSNQASNRARSISYFIILASVIMASAFWNAWDHSWTAREITVYKSCQLWLTPRFEEWRDVPYRDTHELIQVMLRQQLPEITDATVLDLPQAKALQVALERNIQQLVKKRFERDMQFAMPFFGVSFHVNDLQIIGGASLTVLMALLLASLRQERNCLHLALEAAEARGQVPDAYRLLTMTQLFSSPPSAWDERRGLGIPLHGARLILLLPPLVQTVVTLWNLTSIPLGMVISPFNAITNLVGGLTLALAIWAMSISGWNTSCQLDDDWRRWYSKAVRPREIDPEEVG